MDIKTLRALINEHLIHIENNNMYLTKTRKMLMLNSYLKTNKDKVYKRIFDEVISAVIVDFTSYYLTSHIRSVNPLIIEHELEEK